MKKGCFLIFVILLFIVIAGGIYIYKYHKEEFVNFGKETLVSLLKTDLEDKFDVVKNSVEKDSLKAITFEFMDKLKNENLEEKQNEIERLSKLIKKILKDSVVTPEELTEVKKLIRNYGQK